MIGRGAVESKILKWDFIMVILRWRCLATKLRHFNYQPIRGRLLGTYSEPNLRGSFEFSSKIYLRSTLVMIVDL